MLRIKSAQTPDFTDVNVRRVLGYAMDALKTDYNATKDTNPENARDAQWMMNAISEQQQQLLSVNPYVTLQGLRQTDLGEVLAGILGHNHCSFNQNAGMAGEP